MVQGECNQTCLNCWAAAHVLKEKDTCERVQSDYQNFRNLKSEFLEPPFNSYFFLVVFFATDFFELVVFFFVVDFFLVDVFLVVVFDVVVVVTGL